jgi:hypothetical protein
MATQAFIIEQENVIIEAEKLARRGEPINAARTLIAIRQAAQALACERANGGMIRANRNCWDTLGVNVSCLARLATGYPDVKTEANHLADLLCVYRHP